MNNKTKKTKYTLICYRLKKRAGYEYVWLSNFAFVCTVTYTQKATKMLVFPLFDSRSLTDGTTDGRTDGRTKTLIELRVRNKKGLHEIDAIQNGRWITSLEKIKVPDV